MFSGTSYSQIESHSNGSSTGIRHIQVAIASSGSCTRKEIRLVIVIATIIILAEALCMQYPQQPQERQERLGAAISMAILVCYRASRLA